MSAIAASETGAHGTASASAASGQRLLPLEEALERILDGVATLPAEVSPLHEAAGRVLAADLYADTALPPWDNSAMDGFAVRSANVTGASRERPVRLRVTGEVAAGRSAERTVRSGTTVRIMTGAPLPAGADAVVPVEMTSAWRGPRASSTVALPRFVEIHGAVAPGEHVRRREDDVAVGSRVMVAGQRVTAGAVALAAAVGRDRVSVVRRPRLAIVATGDEVIAPGEPVQPGRIHDANSAGLAVLARRAGAATRTLGIAGDDMAAVGSLLREAIAWADVVVATGGVSVGVRDVVKDAFDEVGSVDFWRVAVQPGKPLAFGRAERPTGAPAGDPILLFGLPGNPVSAYVTFELFVRPVLRALAGLPPHARHIGRAVLADRVTKSPERRAFLRVRLGPGPTPGRLPVASLSGGQGSHMISALAAADALAVVPEGIEALEAGSEVEIWPLEEDA